MSINKWQHVVILAVCLAFFGCGDEDQVDAVDTSTPLDLSGGTSAGATEGSNNGTPNNQSGASQGSNTGPSGMSDGRDSSQPESNNSSMGAAMGGNSDCTQSGFVAARELAGMTSAGVQYQALTATQPSNVMITQVYRSFDGPTMPGRYALDGINYRDCGLCLLVLVNCDQEGNCEKTLYAEEGTVEITALDSDRFAARYENVVYREVTVSEGDSTSTIVPGGMTLCANGYEFDQAVQEGSSGGGANEEDICNGPTACVGEVVANFQVTSCATGQPQGMRDYFEGAENAVLMGTSGWCPSCSARIPGVVRYSNANPGTRIAYLLGETSSRSQPSVRYCEQYARSKGVPLEQIFIDHDGTYSHSSFFQSMYPYPEDGAIGLPYFAVIDPVTGEYLYGDGGPTGIPSSVIGIWQ